MNSGNDRKETYKINMSFAFPKMHSDEMETIFLHHAMKHATALGFFVSLVILILLYLQQTSIELKDICLFYIASGVLSCIFNIVLFFKRHKPSRYNLIITSKIKREVYLETISYSMGLAVILVLFFMLLPTKISLGLNLATLFLLGVSPYIVGGITALTASVLIINIIRLRWKLII